MVELLFELQDHADNVHRSFRSELGTQSTLGTLNRLVEKAFFINVIEQRLYLESGQKLDGLGEESIESFGLKHRSRVIVRHSLAANWIEFVVHFELARQALASKLISEVETNVDHAQGHLKPLLESKYFVVFPKSSEVFRNFRNDFDQYIDREFKYIEMATRDYFPKIFADNPECPSITTKCDKTWERERMQGNLICKVLRRETPIGRYYIKEHMGLANFQRADLRQLFVHKLFELIQIGPKVHFIPNTHYPCLGLYIGTEEVIGFQRENTKGVHLSAEMKAQREVLRRVMYIHLNNYGIDGNGNLSIIDFEVKTYFGSVTVKQYFAGYKDWKGGQELRSRIAKDCIESLNLFTMVDRANEAIAIQKELFKIYSISCEEKRDFNKYFQQIKNNINDLLENST